MRILTRSRRIRRALRRVLARIPAKDRQVIAAFVERVWATREWETVGLGSALRESSADLLPLYDLALPEPERWNRCAGQIRFLLPVCRLFSDRALVGIVAHELAHAARIAKLGPGSRWWMWYHENLRRYRAEERRADAITSAWGFGPHIRAMRRERRTVVTPMLQFREEKLIRRVHRREKREYEEARRYRETRKALTAGGSQ